MNGPRAQRHDERCQGILLAYLKTGDGAAEHNIVDCLHGVLLTPQIELGVLDRTLGFWATTRDCLTHDDGSVTLPGEAVDQWRHDLRLLEALIQNPTTSHITAERIVAEARAETGLRLYLDGDSEIVSPIVTLLGGFLQLQPTLTPAQQEDVLHFAFHRKDREVYPQLHHALLDQSWFHYPECTPIRTCLRYEEGRAHLRQVRHSVDVETWDALEPSWQGTIGELKEACSLVGGDNPDRGPWW